MAGPAPEMEAILDSARAALWSLPLFIAVVAAFALAERRWPAGPHKDAAGWRLNAGVTLLYVFTPALVTGLTAALLAWLSNHVGLGLIDLRPRWHSGFLGAALTTIIWVAVFDFFYYWWHRLQHESGLFWRVHKLHHIDPQLNASTDYRHHWLEDLLRVPFLLVPMSLLFKVEPAVAFVLVMWTVFIHANLRLHLGPFARVIAGPQLHRIHHSRLPQHFDRNYAAFLPIYDQLFGSYYHPAPGEFPPTGVDGEPEMRSLREAAWLPFAKPRKPWRSRAQVERELAISDAADGDRDQRSGTLP